MCLATDGQSSIAPVPTMQMFTVSLTILMAAHITDVLDLRIVQLDIALSNSGRPAENNYGIVLAIHIWHKNTYYPISLMSGGGCTQVQFPLVES